MVNFVKIRYLFLCIGVLLLLSSCPWDESPNSDDSISDSKTIPIIPIAQQTEVWCWAAVSEMVLRHSGLPNLNPAGNYQCGIVAAYYGPNSSCWQNCFTCISTIGGMTETQKIINQYGLVSNNLGVQSRILTSTLVFRGLNLSEVVEEIKNQRPIIAGISPTGFALPNLSQHVALIVGYDAFGLEPLLVVNDPFPFGMPQFGGQPNPYLALGAVQTQPGQYKISLKSFITNLKWANTIYRIN